MWFGRGWLRTAAACAAALHLISKAPHAHAPALEPWASIVKPLPVLALARAVWSHSRMRMRMRLWGAAQLQHARANEARRAVRLVTLGLGLSAVGDVALLTVSAARTRLPLHECNLA